MVGYDSGILSDGYGIIPRIVLDDKRLSSGAKLVYSCLCSYGKQKVETSIRTLCRECGITNKTVSKRLKELECAGYIQIIKQTRADGGNASNLYVLETQIPKTFEGGAENEFTNQ